MLLQLVEKELSYLIVAAFFEVYNELGFGFLESLYARALEIALTKRGLTVQREFPVPVYFQGQQIGFHRLDMLVDGRVVIEIKSTELLPPIAKRQLRSYVTATKLDLGILLHFGLKAEYHRVLGARVS
ncbi:MAG TPA: GxxExxY protein [Gemmatimonadaceae bacterium]|nr:GxxExxY protein [Gemmatimonadaceae bacterium]